MPIPPPWRSRNIEDVHTDDSRGVFLAAKSDIPARERLISVDKAHVVSPFAALCALPTWTHPVAARLSPHTVIALRLLLPEPDASSLDDAGLASVQWAVTNCSGVMTSPLALGWSQEEFDAVVNIDGPASGLGRTLSQSFRRLAERARQDFDLLDTAFRHDREAESLSSPSFVSWKDFCRAFMFVKSRALQYPASVARKVHAAGLTCVLTASPSQDSWAHPDCATVPGLTPLIDLLNHTAGSDLSPAIVSATGEVVLEVGGTPLPAGREVAIDYGFHSAEFFALEYGFVPSDNTAASATLELVTRGADADHYETQARARRLLVVPDGPLCQDLRLSHRGGREGRTVPLRRQVTPEVWAALAVHAVAEVFALGGEAVVDQPPLASSSDSSADCIFGGLESSDEMREWWESWSAVEIRCEGPVTQRLAVKQLALKWLGLLLEDTAQRNQLHTDLIASRRETACTAGASGEALMCFDALRGVFDEERTVLDWVRNELAD